jgi:hypothetical protein
MDCAVTNVPPAAQVNLLELRSSSLWMHNVYLRSNALALSTEGDFVQPFGMLAVSHGDLYLSSVVFQGQLTPVNGSVVRSALPALAVKASPVSMGTSKGNDTLAHVLMTGALRQRPRGCSTQQHRVRGISRAAASPVLSLMNFVDARACARAPPGRLFELGACARVGELHGVGLPADTRAPPAVQTASSPPSPSRSRCSTARSRSCASC